MKKNRGRETQARIAAAALDLLREKGSAGLTMRQVAARSGLSLSNVQYYFKSREQLLIGITEHHLTLCHEAMVQGLEEAGEITLRSSIHVSLCNEAVLASAPAFRELFALARNEPGVHERLTAYYMNSHRQFVDFLAAESARPREDLSEIVTLLMTSIEGAYLLTDATPVSNERLAKRLEEVALLMLNPS